MTETIVDIKECLKACPKNAFVYDSGPNEGKCLCVGDICDDNMTATDEGRTYELLTMRQPEVLFDGYCRKNSAHMGTIDPNSPHDIWKMVERCSRTEYPAAMVKQTDGNVYCTYDYSCTDYYQYSTADYKTYGLTDVQFAAPGCTYACDFLTESNEVHYQDDFYITEHECRGYALDNSLTYEFTDNPDQAQGCSKKDNTVYWRDIDMKFEQYGYCNNNAQFQANINISNVLEYRQCYEGCKTHGYNHIAVSTSGECKCVESCSPGSQLPPAGYYEFQKPDWAGDIHPWGRCDTTTTYDSWKLTWDECYEQAGADPNDPQPFFSSYGTQYTYGFQCATFDTCDSIESGTYWEWKSYTTLNCANNQYLDPAQGACVSCPSGKYGGGHALACSDPDYAWATYSPIDDMSPVEHIVGADFDTSNTLGICNTPISDTVCETWAKLNGYDFSDTTSTSYNLGCTYDSNHVYFRDPSTFDYWATETAGYCTANDNYIYSASGGQPYGAALKVATYGDKQTSGTCWKWYVGSGRSTIQCAQSCLGAGGFALSHHRNNYCYCTSAARTESECSDNWYYDSGNKYDTYFFWQTGTMNLADTSKEEKERCYNACLARGYSVPVINKGAQYGEPQMCLCSNDEPCDTMYERFYSYPYTPPPILEYTGDKYMVDAKLLNSIHIPMDKYGKAYCYKMCIARGFDQITLDETESTCTCSSSACVDGYIDEGLTSLSGPTTVYNGYGWVITGGPTEILGSGYTNYALVSSQAECIQTCQANGFNFSSFATNSVRCRCSNTPEEKHTYGYGTGVYQFYPSTDRSVIDKLLFDGNIIDLEDYNTLASLSCDKIVVYDTGEYGCTTSGSGLPVNNNVTKIYKIEGKGPKFELNSSQQVVHDKQIKEKYYTLWYNAPDGWILRNVTSDEILGGGIDNWQLPCTNHMEFFDTSYVLQHQWKYYFFGDDSYAMGHQEYCEGYTEPSMTLRSNLTYYNNGKGMLESCPTFTDPNYGQIRSNCDYLEDASPVWEAPPGSACTDNPWIEGTAPGQRMYWWASYSVTFTYGDGHKAWSYTGGHSTDYADVAVRRGDPNQPGRCKPSNAFFKQIFNRTSDLKGCAPAPYTKAVDTLYPLDIECTKTYTNTCERKMGCRNCVAEGILTNALTYQELSVETPQGKCTKCVGQPRYGEGCETLITRDFTYENEDCQPHYFVVGVQYEYSGKPSNMFDARDCEKLAPNIGKEFKSGFSNSAPKGCYYNEHYMYHAPDYTLQTSGYPESLYTSIQCSNYSQDFNYTFDTTDSNSVPFGCSQWENAVFFKPFNESVIAVQCGAPFSNSTVACVVERDLDCSFQYGCVQKESVSEYRYIYNQVPSLEYGLTSQECLGFAQSIQKEMRTENSLERPRGCYTNLALVMFNTNTSSVVQLSFTHEYEERKAMKDWELYTIGVEKNGIKLID